MKKLSITDKFIFYEYRNLLAYGDDADAELRITGNVTELNKLIKIIGEAIQNAEENVKDGYSEDDIDGNYVLITAFVDGKRIKEPKEDTNPFEMF